MSESKSAAELAAALYGGTTPVTSGTDSGPGRIEHRPGEGFVFRDQKAGTPAPAPGQRQGSDSAEQTLYGNIGPDHVIDPNIREIADAIDMPEAERAGFRNDTHSFLRSLTPDRGIQRELHTLVTRTALKPASDETRQQWREQSDKLVKERYGADGPKLLKAAVSVIKQSDPQLNELFKTTGLGDNPRFVEVFMERARQGEKQPIAGGKFLAAYLRNMKTR